MSLKKTIIKRSFRYRQVVCAPKCQSAHKNPVVSLLLQHQNQSNRASKKQKATPAIDPAQGYKYNRGEEEKVSLHLFSDDFDAVFVQPGSLLFLGGVQDRLCALHRVHVELGGVGAAVDGRRHADFVRGVEHHVVFPQATGAVEDAQHALLHVHVLRGCAPGERVVPLALRAFHERWRAREGDAVFGVCEALFS